MPDSTVTKGFGTKLKNLGSSLVSSFAASSKKASSEKAPPSLDPHEPWSFLIAKSRDFKAEGMPWEGTNSIPMTRFNQKDLTRFQQMRRDLTFVSWDASFLAGHGAKLVLDDKGELSITDVHPESQFGDCMLFLDKLWGCLDLIHKEPDGHLCWLQEWKKDATTRASTSQLASGADIHTRLEKLQTLLKSLPSVADLKAALSDTQESSESS